MDDEEPINFTDEDVSKILNQMANTKSSKENTLPSRKDMTKALTSYMSEFLACYRLMGYDLNGKPINLKVYSNKLEEDALTQAFVENIATHMEGE